MSNSKIYEFNVKDGLIFDGGKWGINHNKTLLNDQNVYEITLTLTNLEKKESKYNITLRIPFDNQMYQDFVSVKGTSFLMRINSVVIDSNLDEILIIEIKNESYMDIQNCYVCNNSEIRYFYDCDGLPFCSSLCIQKHFGPKRGPEGIILSDEDEPSTKKVKTVKNIDMLIIGVDHAKNENILDDNLIKALNSFSFIKEFNNDKILVKNMDAHYSLNNRKPFLIFWEHFKYNDNEIKIADITGRDSSSWQIPGESNLARCFSTLETCFYLYLFPIDFDEKTKTPLSTYNNKNNTGSIKIQEGLTRRHGGNIYNIDTYRFGYHNPVALEYSFSFINRLVTALKNANSSDFLDVIITNNEQREMFYNRLRGLVNDIIRAELKEEFKDIVIEYVNEYILQYGGNYNTLIDIYTNMSKYTVTTLFNSKIVTVLLTLLYTKGFIYGYYDKVKKFIFETWSFIAAHTNPKFFKYEKGPYLNINTKESDLILKNDIIDTKYFVDIINNIKNEIDIDIPTSLYNRLVLLYDDGLINASEKIGYDQTSLFVQLRNIILFKNMVNICLKTGIDRIIVLSGTGHIDHLRYLTETQKYITFDIDVYNIFRLETYNLFRKEQEEKFSTETKLFISTLQDKILMYYMLEKIDYWLYYTEQYKNQISDHESSEKKRFKYHPLTDEDQKLIPGYKQNDKGIPIKIKLDYPREKLQEKSELYISFNGRPDDPNFTDNHYYIIGWYLMLIMYITPYYQYIINNYPKQYMHDDNIRLLNDFTKEIEKKFKHKLPYFNDSKVNRVIGTPILLEWNNVKYDNTHNVYDIINDIMSK